MDFDDKDVNEKQSIREKVEEIYRMYAVSMFRYALKEFEDEELAHECTQRSYEKLMKYVHKFDRINSPGTRAYVMEVVRTCTVDIRRDAENNLSIYDEDVSFIIDSSIGRSAKECDINEERENILSEMIKSALNEKDRRLLELFYGEGLSGRETAEELGISEVACRKRTERMKKKVKAYMIMKGYVR